MMAPQSTRVGGFTLLIVLGLVVIGLGLIAGAVFMWTQQTRGIAEAFRPQIDSKVVLSGTIEKLQTEGKLVVLTADVQAEARSSTRKILLGFVDLGETDVRVRAPARVQYVIPLEGITRDDFSYDPQKRRMVLAIPNPRLDTSIVEVSTDPSKVEIERTVGWLRLDSFTDRYDERRAHRLLRDAAIHAGRSGTWIQQAQESADAELRRLLAPLIESLEEDVTLVIAFHGDRRDVPDGESLPRPASS